MFSLPLLSCACPLVEPAPPAPAPGPQPGPLPPGPSPEDAMNLVRRFCPLIYLKAEGDAEENFQPDAVQLMVDVSLLRDLSNPAFSEKPTADALLRWSRSGYYLDVADLDPVSHSVSEYKASYERVRGSYQPTVYARIVEEARYTVVQYWLFYYMNDWRNIHEGDWELVQLHFPKSTVKELLATGEPPLFAAYSQHQSGQQMSWSDMEARGLVSGTHPFVYVAQGSHANYFLPGQFWSVLDFDDTGLSSWRVIEPAQLNVVLLRDVGEEREELPWLGFRGYWGEYLGFSVSIMGLSFWQRGPFGPQWSDEDRKSQKWEHPEAWAAGLPEYPEPFWKSFLRIPGDWSKLAIFQVFSPAELHVYDAQGRHVGLDEEGNIERSIPGALYIIPEGTDYKTILIPDADVADEYRIVVKGTDAGVMDIKAQVPDVKTELRRFLEYIAVPVSRSLVARAFISPVLPMLPERAMAPAVAGVRATTTRDLSTQLEMDNDGDGVFDAQSPPGRFVKEAVTPLVPPMPAPETEGKIRQEQPETGNERQEK